MRRGYQVLMVPKARGDVRDVSLATPSSSAADDVWPDELVERIVAHERKVERERESERERAWELARDPSSLSDRLARLDTA